MIRSLHFLLRLEEDNGPKVKKGVRVGKKLWLVKMVGTCLILRNNKADMTADFMFPAERHTALAE